MLLSARVGSRDRRAAVTEEFCSDAGETHPVPVLKHQSLKGCLRVWLGWHAAAQVVHEGLHNTVVLGAHLQCFFFSMPHRTRGIRTPA